MNISPASDRDARSARADIGDEFKSLDAGLKLKILAIFLGQTAVLAGLGYFALTHLPR